ncbi:MAG: hypothetical protein WBF89_10375 [Steroidobacteraceae bacterium]|jgi:hypothetical protein
MISTKADFARALQRLRGRDPESLAAFIVSLAQDSGPIGEQVRTFIVESIESLMMPVDPRRAFELLVLLFESDGVAMENCGDHDFEVTCAFERAAELIGKAARSLPAVEVTAALEPLLDDDGYGVRGALAEVISGQGAAR